jgi:hypothetical protein
MSRTYRRKGGDPTWKDWYRELASYSRRYRNEKVFEAVYHSDGYGTMHSTPSAWTNTFMTVPQRQEVRRLIGKVMRLSDLEDAPLFPLPKKPHHYYW